MEGESKKLRGWHKIRVRHRLCSVLVHCSNVKTPKVHLTCFKHMLTVEISSYLRTAL